MKTREVYCVRVHSNIKEPVRVENKHCRAEDKPAQHEENCNTTVCPPQWKESSWGSVSTTISYYTLVPHLGTTPRYHTLVTHLGTTLTRPSLIRKIIQCKPCGRGWAHRVVTCMDWNQQKVLPDSQCDPQRKPKTSKRCHKRCPLPRWKTGKWSEVSSFLSGFHFRF